MVYGRVRNRSISTSSGTATWQGAGSIAPATSTIVTNETCADIVGNVTGDNAFTLERSCNAIFSLHGNSLLSMDGWDYGGYMMTSFPGAHGAPTSVEPPISVQVADAMSRTNPNRPEVDVPVFVRELFDIPMMVRRSLESLKNLAPSLWNKPVRTLARSTGEANLMWEFFIKPTISDLQKMMQFEALTEKKLRQLKNLDSGGGQKRKATTWSDTYTYPTWTLFETPLYAETNQVQLVFTTVRKSWVSMTWKPLYPVSTMSDADARALAFRLAYGLEFSLATLWEAMPWSWLIDWFSNVGDLFGAHRNGIPVVHTGTCYMRHTITAPTSFTRIGAQRAASTLRLYPSTREEKIRTPYGGPILPTFYLPFLDVRQLSILSSLLVTRM